VFIDRNPATGDLVVYHANRMSLTKVPGPDHYLAITPLDEQYREARIQMDVDYTTLQHALGGGLVSVAQLRRPTYYQCIEVEKNRKRAQGRSDVDALGGTNVMGFRVGGNWQFWWQTWAILSYNRPITAPEALRSGRRQDIELGTGKLLAVEQFV